MSSVICFNLYQSKVLSSGNRLKVVHSLYYKSHYESIHHSRIHILPPLAEGASEFNNSISVLFRFIYLQEKLDALQPRIRQKKSSDSLNKIHKDGLHHCMTRALAFC